MKALLKYVFLLCVGGIVYCMLEHIFRGRSHWSMFIVGGIAFILCGLLNEFFPWELPLATQMLVCCITITWIEFLSGIVLNVYLGLNVWDYSDLPFNILGQICPQFTALWFLLGGVAIILDDYVRYWFFSEEKPRYRIF